MTKVQAHKTEGVGLVLPERDPAHAEDNWYQRDLDDDVDDPDTEPVDPLPTTRHREIPEED
jgi:hypothetical protein